METKLTEQQSLEVITEMINRARNNIQRGSGNHMIFWGYWSAFTALLNVILIYTLENPHQSYLAWWLMIPGGVVSWLWSRKIDKSRIVKTHIDDIIRSAWRSCSVSMIVFLMIIFVLAGYWDTGYQLFMIIIPAILLHIGAAEYITAGACRYRPFMYGAFAMWAGAVAGLAVLRLSAAGTSVQFGIFIACMVIGFIIPGYRLNKLAGKHV
jgi:hypothetical protein